MDEGKEMRQEMWLRRAWHGIAVGTLLLVLAGCASPEGAVNIANETATAAAPGPPALRIATIGVGPMSVSATSQATGSVVAGIASGATVRPASGTAGVPGTAVTTAGTPVKGATAVSTLSLTPQTGITASSVVSRSAPRGTPEPGLLLDPKGRYSFRIPTLWKAQTPMASGVDLEAVCDDPNGLVRTTSVDTPTAITLDNATLAITEALKKNTMNYEPVPAGSLNAMIGGQAARRIEYYGIYSGTRLHYVSYVIVYNQKTVVTLLFVAQPDNFDRLLMQGSVVLTTFAFGQPASPG